MYKFTLSEMSICSCQYARLKYLLYHFKLEGISSTYNVFFLISHDKPSSRSLKWSCIYLSDNNDNRDLWQILIL